MAIKKIGVVGYGTMGRGIVASALMSGLAVKVMETEQRLLESGNSAVAKSISKLIEKGKIQGKVEDYLQKCTGVLSFGDLTDCELIIEAVFEDKNLKIKVFKELDSIMPPDVVLATNTSSISISEIAANTGRPARVAGMHFMNPVPLMQLVEVVIGTATSENTRAVVTELAASMGKTAVEVKDSPGFVVNRLLIPMINEACFLVHEGVADAKSIDSVMKLGANHPIGPLALADMIGLDVVLSIMEVIAGGFNDPKYRSCPVLKDMVKSGKLGKKTGQGFYTYA